MSPGIGFPRLSLRRRGGGAGCGALPHGPPRPSPLSPGCRLWRRGVLPPSHPAPTMPHLIFFFFNFNLRRSLLRVPPAFIPFYKKRHHCKLESMD